MNHRDQEAYRCTTIGYDCPTTRRAVWLTHDAETVTQAIRDMQAQDEIYREGYSPATVIAFGSLAIALVIAVVGIMPMLPMVAYWWGR